MPLEYMMIVSLVTLFSAIFGVTFGLINWKRTHGESEKKAGETLSEIRNDVKHLCEDISYLKYEFKDINNEIKEHRERLTLIEQKVKSAHARIDEIKGKKGVFHE